MPVRDPVLVRSEVLMPFSLQGLDNIQLVQRFRRNLSPPCFRQGGVAEFPDPFLPFPCLYNLWHVTNVRNSSTLNVEAAGSSETPVPIDQITRHNIQDESNPLSL